MIGANAAGDDQLFQAADLDRLQGLFHQHLDDRILEAARDIGASLFAEHTRFPHLGQYSRFQAAETEIQIARVQHRTWKLNRLRSPAHGELCECRTTGVRQTEQFGCFIEGFAGGIVKRLAEQEVLPDASNVHQLTMAA